LRKHHSKNEKMDVTLQSIHEHYGVTKITSRNLEKLNEKGLNLQKKKRPGRPAIFNADFKKAVDEMIASDDTFLASQRKSNYMEHVRTSPSETTVST
jgi:transposase